MLTELNLPSATINELEQQTKSNLGTKSDEIRDRLSASLNKETGKTAYQRLQQWLANCGDTRMKQTILLVEDNETNIHAAKKLLEDCGCTDILIARNGQEALKL